MKLVNYWDKYTEMYGQQNLKKYIIVVSAFNTYILEANHCFMQTYKTVPHKEWKRKSENKHYFKTLFFIEFTFFSIKGTFTVLD